MSDVLLLLQMVAKRLSVLSLFAAVLLLLSHLWLYTVIALIIAGCLLCIGRIIKEKCSGPESDRRWYTLIVVSDEVWDDEEDAPFFEMDSVSLELHYQYDDIRGINPQIQLQELPGFILVETDDTKRIDETLENPSLVTSNYAEVVRFLKAKAEK
ncbi:hypothetical protein BpJC7_31330 [Weizmannia acidilactici]|uniref:Uncharacterized protein n=2 Tax=Weizmannia acidilactici TaxID=2607726 RepID=A0A5J4JME7_9BACI|nr:hypothetical protein BpJC4_11820 [Weizmannia acidilactici]GER71830.1 hypothetical protein BpJC7_31330 [Weizmannia acidilactici]GER72865.1 hypothetical protein BpPP18_09320 [Weizmannia acidilactici]